MSRTITFTIRGNQKDTVCGNPIPYKRTLKGKFRKDSVDYFDWKEYVRAEYSRSAAYEEAGEHVQAGVRMIPGKDGYYPLIADPGELVAISMRIYTVGKGRGDGDNILKGILDSLFEQDNIVWSGAYACYKARDLCPRVAVTLRMNTEKEMHEAQDFL